MISRQPVEQAVDGPGQLIQFVTGTRPGQPLRKVLGIKPPGRPDALGHRTEGLPREKQAPAIGQDQEDGRTTGNQPVERGNRCLRLREGNP